MAENQELKLKLTVDSKDAEDGTRRAGLAFTELNSKFDLTGKAISALQSGYQLFMGTINRGQGVSELSTAFNSLGGTSAQLDKLRTSMQGLVSDTDIMRASNEALLAGLSPEQFERVAAAADSLGDAVGVNTKDAMDQLTRAVNTGNERLLKQYGIVIDNKKAEEDFARQIGVSAEQLNEAGKKEAARIAILNKMDEQVKKVGAAPVTAGDGVQRLGAAFDNILDKITKGINENQDFALALNHIATELAEIDPEPFIRGIQGIVSALGQGIGYIDDFARGIEILLNKTDRARAYNLDHAIKSNAGDRSSFGRAFGEFVPQLQEELQALNAAHQSMESFQQTLNQFPALYDDATNGIQTFTGKLVYQRDAFVDTGKAAKDAGEKGLKEFQGTLETITGIFDKTYATDGTFFEKAFGAQDSTWIQDKLDEQFQASVDFFGDILTPMFDDSAANFEDIFKDAAKRIAIGFGSQMLASIAGSLGLGGVGGIGGAGGLGQLIASAIGFGGGAGGGGAGLANILSGASTVASGASYLTGGSAAASADFIGPVAPSVSTLGATVGIGAAVAGGAALFYNAVKEFEKSNKDYKDAASAGAQTYFAGDVTGISQAYFAAMSAFGGSQDPGVLMRRSLRGSLQQTGLGDDLSFQGVGGRISLFDSRYTQDPSNSLNAGATALANPLATVFAQGGGDAQTQLAAMFADATDNADNFNEVIVNTAALMDSLGINVDDAKNTLEQLFLDGKIGLDEFTSGVSELNIVAQDDLIGDSSILDAFNILSKNLGEEGSPRVALKGLQLAFKEMAQQGIDSPEEIKQYVTEHFGPEVAHVFEELGKIGVDSFDDIGQLGPDKLAQVFGALDELTQGFTDAKTASDDIGNSDGLKRQADNANNLKKKLDDAAKSARELKKAIDQVPEAPSGAQNPNQPNNAHA